MRSLSITLFYLAFTSVMLSEEQSNPLDFKNWFFPNVEFSNNLNGLGLLRKIENIVLEKNDIKEVFYYLYQIDVWVDGKWIGGRWNAEPIWWDEEGNLLFTFRNTKEIEKETIVTMSIQITFDGEMKPIKCRVGEGWFIDGEGEDAVKPPTGYHPIQSNKEWYLRNLREHLNMKEANKSFR